MSTRDRNQSCPTCGQKMKRCSCHEPRFTLRQKVLAFSVCFGLCLVAFALTLVLRFTFPLAPVANAELAAHVRRMTDAYLDAKPADHWWFTAFPPPPEQPEQYAATVERVAAIEAKAHSLLQRYAGTTDLSQAIADAFPRLHVMVYTQGMSVRLTQALTPEEALPPPNSLELCIIPQHEIGAHPNLLYYKPEWKALMVAAVDWPDAVFAALLFHELGHALRHRQGAPSATAPPNSDAYVDEEVEMHELEAAVLIAASQGQFASSIKAVIARAAPVVDWPVALHQLELGDLRQLDQTIGADRAGQRVTSVMATQYLLTFGLWAIPQRPTDAAGYQADRRAIYRWLSANVLR